MQSFDGLTIFIQVVEQHSFSAAANVMRTSKANVSRQIARLEERLGVQLFQRSTRSINLTEAGHTLYQNTKETIYSLDDALNEIMNKQAEPRGTLRISTAGLYGETRVAAVAADYMQKYEGVKVELHFSDRNVDIINEGYDLAIRAGVLEDSALIARRISSRRLILCASPKYLANSNKLDSISDLKQHHCLKSASSFWYFTDKRGKKLQYKVDAVWQSNNAHATLQACLRGAGIAQLPEYYVRSYLKSKQLQAVLPAHEPADNGIWAVYSNKHHLSAKVKYFIEMLLAQEDSAAFE